MATPSPTASPTPPNPRPPVRSGVWILCALVAAAVGGGIWLVRTPESAPAPMEAAPTEEPAAAALPPPEPAPALAPLVDRAPAPPPPASAPAPTAPAPKASSARWPEPSAYTRQLMAALTELDPKNGPMTPEQIALWKQTMQTLLQQGAAAVPAIMEFLERNVDLDLKGLAGDQLGTSLRQTMFEALAQIGSDGFNGLADVLQSTLDPREIASVAGLLEDRAPEQFRNAVVDAAREALAHLAGKKIEGVDVAPLFELLQKFGGPDVVNDLTAAAKTWGYYAPLAIANLPPEFATPALVSLAEDRNFAASGGGAMAMRLLAERAFTDPTAQEALLRLAEQGKIPASAYLGISQALAGHVAHYGSGLVPGAAPPPPTLGQQHQRFHIASGNQQYESRYQPPPPEQVAQRLELVDKLLKLQQSPIAANALNNARRVLQPGP